MSKQKLFGYTGTLLYVGRIATNKRIELLIKSFSLAKKILPELTLLLVGKETFPRYIKMLKKKQPKGVFFIGFVSEEELVRYYRIADLYVSTSSDEGFDFPLNEAQACGIKAVVFDNSSRREMLKEGVLVLDDGNVNDFAKGIIYTLKNKFKGVVEV